MTLDVQSWLIPRVAIFEPVHPPKVAHPPLPLPSHRVFLYLSLHLLAITILSPFFHPDSSLLPAIRSTLHPSTALRFYLIIDLFLLPLLPRRASLHLTRHLSTSFSTFDDSTYNSTSDPVAVPHQRPIELDDLVQSSTSFHRLPLLCAPFITSSTSLALERPSSRSFQI